MKASTLLLCTFALCAPGGSTFAAPGDSTDSQLLSIFLELVEQAPPLQLQRETISDGIVLPLAKTVARADGLTVSVIADHLQLATTPSVRQTFATFADRFLGQALLRLPRRPVQSPQAPGLIEYRMSGPDGALFMLAWRSDAPFASASASASADGDACSRLLPPFEQTTIPKAARAGLLRRQTYSRSFGGLHYQRTTHAELREERSRLRWQVNADECTTSD